MSNRPRQPRAAAAAPPPLMLSDGSVWAFRPDSPPARWWLVDARPELNGYYGAYDLPILRVRDAGDPPPLTASDHRAIAAVLEMFLPTPSADAGRLPADLVLLGRGEWAAVLTLLVAHGNGLADVRDGRTAVQSADWSERYYRLARRIREQTGLLSTAAILLPPAAPPADPRDG